MELIELLCIVVECVVEGIDAATQPSATASSSNLPGWCQGIIVLGCGAFLFWAGVAVFWPELVHHLR